MWAGSVSLPAHALQVVAEPIAGAASPTIDDLCARSLAPLPAALECVLEEAPRAHDPLGYAVCPATLSTVDASTATRPAVDASESPARAHARPVQGRGTRGGWAAQVLVGLATVGLVARRRLGWHARSAALSAPPVAASVSRAASGRRAALAPARPLAARLPAAAMPRARHLA
jgi:hypothetical protein